MTTAPLFAGIGGHHRPTRSTTDEWLTPRYIVDALGGWQSFDLDPCSPIGRPWPTARAHYTVVDNGLILPWFGRVYMNCPYGRGIGRWLGRMAAHGRGVALIFARTDTDAFFRFVWEHASALLFLRGRLDFCDITGRPVRRKGRRKGDQNSGAPSVLCAYGPGDADVLAGCGLSGKFVPLRLPRSVVALALPATWREEVLAWLRRRSGPVGLDEIYRAFAGHPKSAGNPNYQAKIRQVLQQGPFRRVARGQWEYAA